MLKPLLTILIGLFALIAQMVYFIKDDRTENNDPKNKGFNLRWHMAGGLIHLWMYCVIYSLYGIRWACFAASLTWLLFDGCVNSFALNREFFYIGKTAIIDKAQQWAGKISGIDPRAISASLKLLFFFGSIISLIKNYVNG